MGIKSEIQSLSPSALVELFEIDLTSVGGALMRFHAGTNSLSQPVVWQGNTYEALPIEAEGFEVSTRGTLPRPKLRVANVSGIFSAAARDYDDLVGCKITRHRTFARYLDAVNFLKNNYLLSSSNLQAAPWASYKSGTADGTAQIVADPIYGSVLRLTKTAGASADRFGFSQVISGLTGSNYHASMRAKINVAGSTGPAIYVDAAKTAGGLSTVGPYFSGALNAWQAYAAASPTAPLAGGATVYFWVEGPVGSSADFMMPQISLGNSLLPYQETTSAPNPSADPSQYFPDEVWYVEQKTTENRYIVEWELSSALDLQGVMLPGRQVIQSTCVWKYRSAECGYTGGAYFDANDNACALAQDTCAKRLNSCEKRFGNQSLPFGGFPGAVRYG